MSFLFWEEAIKPVVVSSSNIEDLKILDKELFPITWKEYHYKNILNRVNEFAWIFIYNGEIIGQTSLRIKEDQRCYLMTIGVKIEYRSMGFGTFILDFVEKELVKKNVRIIYLHVQLGNINAHRFYIKNKFKVVRIEEDYYTGFDDKRAIVLKKTIV